MKLSIKRAYCPNCRKLVMSQEQKADSNINIICARCHTLLRVWNGIYWKPVRESEKS